VVDVGGGVELSATGVEMTVPTGAVPGAVVFAPGVERRLPTRLPSELEKMGPVDDAFRLGVGVILAGAVPANVVEFNVTGTEVAVPIGAVPGMVAFGPGVDKRLPTLFPPVLENSGPVVVAFRLGIGVTLAVTVVVTLATGVTTTVPPVESTTLVASEAVMLRAPEVTGAVPRGVDDAFTLGDGVTLARGAIVEFKEGVMAPLPDAAEVRAVSPDVGKSPVPEASVLLVLGVAAMPIVPVSDAFAGDDIGPVVAVLYTMVRASDVEGRPVPTEDDPLMLELGTKLAGAEFRTEIGLGVGVDRRLPSLSPSELENPGLVELRGAVPVGRTPVELAVMAVPPETVEFGAIGVESWLPLLSPSVFENTGSDELVGAVPVPVPIPPVEFAVRVAPLVVRLNPPEGAVDCTVLFKVMLAGTIEPAPSVEDTIDVSPDSVNCSAV
jgi:hypothetical protein